MAEDQQFFQQYLRSTTPDGSETVREVVSPSLLDAAGAQQAETAAGRTFVGFVHPDDMPGLGAQPAAPPPPPETPPPAPSLAAQPAAPRSFVSQTPSIVAGTLGGLGGAAVGTMTGPFAPVAVPALAIAGAGLASGGMEALQAAAERAPGATSPPSEPGTPLERAKRAAARGALGEAFGQVVPWVAGLVGGGAGPTLEAAETLAPVLTQGAASPTREVLVRAADGTTRTITDLLANPGDIPAFVQGAPAAQQSLLNSWWQRTAPQGADAVAASWDALGAAGQRALAGDQHAAMTAVVDTVRAGGAPIPFKEWGRIGGRGGVLGGAAHYLGYPELGTALGTVPTAVALTRALAPKVAAPLLLSPSASQWLAALPEVGRAAAPWLGAAGQAGTAAVWPPPVRTVPSPY